ncbi:peptide ABC transporter substrate-binding protein [Fimbriiglobus ruber]|uniref:Peptide ABC transporter substrate-binding protein n=1 Tax=Fimbriiglobus ruber TaxID=1908690 RepID=A0A225D821_9BACT|nr:peptide ABC transporter substrate-binding protein [Fimbriiglobus ruber]OWK35784.1 hypothetical protein FRUB_08347 [Fimbriiglobus ruber]
MTQAISEPDWKLFRHLHAVALDRFCYRVLAEVNRITADSSLTHHARYLEVVKLVDRRDRECAELFDDLRRSTALLQLARIRSLDLVTDEEFAQFSPETRGVVESILEIRSD